MAWNPTKQENATSNSASAWAQYDSALRRGHGQHAPGMSA